jgi:hypothetical protein
MSIGDGSIKTRRTHVTLKAMCQDVENRGKSGDQSDSRQAVPRLKRDVPKET